MNKRLGLTIAALTTATLTFATAQAQTANTVVVSPANMQGWAFFNDNHESAPPTGNFVKGPATPPAGRGSVHFALTDAFDGQIIGTTAYAGQPLSGITNLQYSTYRASPDTGNNLAIALQFDIKYRPADTAYGGRLVFEPYQGAPAASVLQNIWQTWQPLDGLWWASKTTAAGSNGACPQSAPCTWAQVKAAFPNAAIGGALLFKAGSNWSGFDGNADALTVGTTAGSTTYDFELGPTNKDECKNGGWTGIYKNQGECVSSFERHSSVTISPFGS
jgi:hypothetical protein